MEDKIKKYLEDFEVPYNAEHWNLMEQRMAIEELSDYMNKEDEAFDEYVRKEVQFQEPAYNRLHWELMAEKLEERTWRGFIYKYKLAEVGLMMLLLWTLWFTVIPQKEEVQVALNTVTTQQVATPDASSTVSIPSKETPFKSSFTSQTKDEEVVFLNPVISEVKYKVSTDLNGLGTFNTLYKASQPAALDKNIISSVFNTSGFNSYASNRIISSTTNYAKVSPDLRIGVFAASGIESISSEEDEEKHESTLAYGYGGGISLGLKFKDIELETGASYNALIPMNISEDALADNTSTKNLDAAAEANGVANKFLKLPFALKYLFDNEGSWKLYAIGGGNVHIDVNNREFQPRSSSFAFDQRSTGARTGAAIAPNQLNQGATFFDRFYYSASIGFGVERQLTDKLSVFVQPEYYHQLYRSALALGNGQTNTFTLSVGLKSSL